jgi:hypothetical protein
MYEIVKKECPACQTTFETKSGHRDEKTVCSKGCANSFFRTGVNHPNYKNGTWIAGADFQGRQYRLLCFSIWPKKCAICGWFKTVEVHHIDGNHKNNELKNLIPLCPNHHKLTKNKTYKNEIDSEIKILVEDFWNKFGM